MVLPVGRTDDDAVGIGELIEAPARARMSTTVVQLSSS
jgi:hypothetical protein